MQSVNTPLSLRHRVQDWRAQGLRIAFVPTMGNLHEGHLTLVRRALQAADRVVVSIFVNPLQFSAGEDLARYPRTEVRDAQLLAEAGAHLLFLPEVIALYPRGIEACTRVEVPGLSDILCGASRPGHFTGVATVVTKLFNLVQPDVAVFGQKDYQQLALIRTLVADLDMPVEIIGVPTQREASGLALSSRNGYMNEAERAQAPGLYAVLTRLRDALQAGEGDIPALEARGRAELEQAGFRPDYLSVRHSADLAPFVPTPGESFVVLGAAWLGTTRLIDNVEGRLAL
ncbi:MAG: pantoate--beta-alanine ligase [Halothiobacillaceae bacterium]|nr:pantoate--beta-alanine ligase [Halothiobacillaceae bacterium]